MAQPALSAQAIAAAMAVIDATLPPLVELRAPTDAWALAHGSTVTLGDHVVKFAWTEEAAHRLVRQARIHAALAQTSVPVPRIVGWHDAPAVLVYQRIGGVPLDLWTSGVSRANERRAAAALATVLAAFHDVRTQQAIERAGVPLERPAAQVTTDGLRARLLHRLHPAQALWVETLAGHIDEVLQSPGESLHVHGDLHGWNVVADTTLTTIVGVLDLDTVGSHEVEFDFRYVPALSPSLAFLRDTVRAYEQHTGRSVDIPRVLAWHALTDLGDALWRTEADIEVVAGPLWRRVRALRHRLHGVL